MSGLMKKILLGVLLVYILLKLAIWGGIYLVTRPPSGQLASHIQTVETFFKEKGYDEIHIIGAHTNGREHEGPFLYGWHWHSFELGEKGKEVVMLYHYYNIEEVEGYLTELNDDIRKECYLSKYFVFYYHGEDEEIRNTIIAFCEENIPEDD